MRAALALLLLVADLGLAGWIYQSLNAPMADRVPAASPRAAPPPSAAPRLSEADRSADVVAILARPVFEQSRRPPAHGGPAPVAMGAPAAVLPRMTAIMVDGRQRSAIFAGTNGKPLVLSEGGRVGPFTIERIEPQQVTITGPEGKRVVHTSFDPNPPTLMPVLPPGMPAPIGLASPGLPAFPLPMPPPGFPPVLAPQR